MTIGIANDVSEKAAQLLREMDSSCTSEGSGVADILNTIASNGEDMASDEHLASCAEEIAGWARHFLEGMGHRDDIETAAQKVIDSWETGDLAGAVTNLRRVLESRGLLRS
jgi:uncharacterized protein YgfB (UPF0149 family)